MFNRFTFGLPKRQMILVYGLLVGTVLLYLCGLGLNQWANPYYSAAVQAGTKSWKAFFYGSFDAANAITTDKTPLSLWLMGLSARVFGFNYFSIILPNILAGVASVGLLFGLLRKRFGFNIAWVSAFVLAITPVAVAVFRFNDPDALLMFFSLAAVAATFKLNDTGLARYAVLVGVILGFGFMTKMLQALLILPALGLTYLLFGRPKLWRRLAHLLLALIALILSGGWWVTIVALTPAADRPYIGGTTTNSIIELIFGYNGLGRLNGQVGNTNGTETGVTLLQPSITRLFGTDVGGHVAWLLPLALISTIAGVILYWRTRRTEPFFFDTLVWGIGLVTSALVFSFMQGIFHEYYTVALAPYIAALTGLGIHIAITRWAERRIRVLSIGAVALTGLLACYLLSKAVGESLPLGLVLICTVVACVLLATFGGKQTRLKLTIAVTGIALLGGQVVYDLTTVTTAQTASIPVAGPPVVFPFTNGGTTGNITPLTVTDLQPITTQPGDINTVYARIRQQEGNATWSAAISNGLPAANMQLATRLPTLELGGYNGKDPFPTLSKFKHLVADHAVRYYVLTGIVPLDANTPLTDAQQIQVWVREHYAPTLIGTNYVYDLR